ncbi:hypothetical protein BH09MYX1_BH09MYX1_29090 [soil metagenome]
MRGVAQRIPRSVRRSPFFALALVVPLLALAAGSALLVGSSFEGGSVATITCCVPIAAALGAFMRRRRAGPTAGIVAASAALGYAVPIFVAALVALREPIATSSSSSFALHCGTGELGFGSVAVFGSLFGSLGMGAIGVGIAALAKRRRVETALRAFAAATIATLLALTAMLARHGARESAATYLDSLAATRRVIVDTPMAKLEAWDGPPVTIAGASFVVQHRVGEGVTTTDLTPPRGSARSCAVVVHRGAVEERHTVSYAYGSDEACPELRVRWVPRYRDRDAFVVERMFAGTRPTWAPALVIDGATLNASDLEPRDVGTLGPPHGWLFGVLGSGAIALLCFVASARASAAVAAGREGEHTGEGWVRFEGAAPRFARELVGEGRGPVLLRGRDLALGYRSDGGASHDAEIVLGTNASVERDALQQRAGFSCLAIAAAVLALAPLLAAMIYDVL